MFHTMLRLAAAGTDISAHLPTLYALAIDHSSISVPIVELGVRTGNSTLALLAACAATHSQLVSYDIDSACPENVRRTAREHTHNWPACDRAISKRWDFRALDSILAADQWSSGGFVGMLFIDTIHEYERTRDELAAWLPKLRRDAVICGHDYPDASGGVKKAVDEFVSVHHELELIVLPHDYGLFVLLPRTEAAA